MLLVGRVVTLQAVLHCLSGYRCGEFLGDLPENRDVFGLSTVSAAAQVFGR